MDCNDGARIVNVFDAEVIAPEEATMEQVPAELADIMPSAFTEAALAGVQPDNVHST